MSVWRSAGVPCSKDHASRRREEMSGANNSGQNNSGESLKLKFLSLTQVRHIDEVLAQLGEYGEVRLVIQHGELRYINKLESYKAWKSEEES